MNLQKIIGIFKRLPVKNLMILLPCVCLGMCACAQLIEPLSKGVGERSNFAQYLSLSQRSQTDEANDKAATNITFNDEENTKGSRFLFNDWVKGDSVIAAEGAALDVSSYVFNYDKLTNSLLASENKKQALSVRASGIQSFRLLYGKRQYRFEHVNTINAARFFLALVKNKEKYSLYREFAVRFIPSNYRNDGLIQTGTLDNEYKDESRYYLVMPDTSFRLLLPKSKVIKDILIKEKEKVDKYFKQHKDEDINEQFLIGLIEEMNK